MNIECVPIDSVSPDPANARRHGPRNLEAIKASLRRFGQQKPVVVNDKGMVIAGNGALAAARELGWKTINVVRTKLQGVEAVAYGIADNRTAELAEWDEAVLAQTLEALRQEEGFDLQATGFSEEDINKLLAEETAEPPEDFAEFDETIETNYQCPKCGYQWSGKPC